MDAACIVVLAPQMVPAAAAAMARGRKQQKGRRQRWLDPLQTFMRDARFMAPRGGRLVSAAVCKALRGGGATTLAHRIVCGDIHTVSTVAQLDADAAMWTEINVDRASVSGLSMLDVAIMHGQWAIATELWSAYTRQRRAQTSAATAHLVTINLALLDTAAMGTDGILELLEWLRRDLPLSPPKLFVNMFVLNRLLCEGVAEHVVIMLAKAHMDTLAYHLVWRRTHAQFVSDLHTFFPSMRGAVDVTRFLSERATELCGDMSK